MAQTTIMTSLWLTRNKCSWILRNVVPPTDVSEYLSWSIQALVLCCLNFLPSELPASFFLLSLFEMGAKHKVSIFHCWSQKDLAGGFFKKARRRRRKRTTENSNLSEVRTKKQTLSREMGRAWLRKFLSEEEWERESKKGGRERKRKEERERKRKKGWERVKEIFEFN